MNDAAPVPSLADLREGDIMFTRIGGWSGRGIELGEKILDAFMPGADHIDHVAVVSQAMAPNGSHGPWIVQAMPDGAEEIEIGDEHWTPDFTYIRLDYFSQSPWAQGPDLRVLRASVARAARKYIGTPYSFLDYAAIAGLHFGIRNGPVRRYVRTTKHMICSQLADQAMSDAGYHVFSDERLPQDVWPSALYRQMLSMSGYSLVPGADWVVLPAS